MFQLTISCFLIFLVIYIVESFYIISFVDQMNASSYAPDEMDMTYVDVMPRVISVRTKTNEDLNCEKHSSTLEQAYSSGMRKRIGLKKLDNGDPAVTEDHRYYKLN